MLADALKTGLTAILSLVVLFLLSKLVGNRQISQMNMFDYITGITIGSIAAELATNLEEPVKPLVAMVVYGVAAEVISLLADKSLKLRRVFLGGTVVIMDKGVIYRNAMKKAHINISEFLTFCRTNGYFDLSEIETAILECSGSISILPKESARPICPADLQLQPRQKRVLANVILDGKVMEGILRRLGKDAKWLENELLAQGVKSVKDVFLATLDEAGALSVYPYSDGEKPQKTLEM